MSLPELCVSIQWLKREPFQGASLQQECLDCERCRMWCHVPRDVKSTRAGIPGPASVAHCCQLLTKYLSALLLTKCLKLEERERERTQTDMVLYVGRTRTQTSPRCMDRNIQKTGVWLCLCIIKISWLPFNPQQSVEVYIEPQLSCLRKEWVLDVLVTSAGFLPSPNPRTP